MLMQIDIDRTRNEVRHTITGKVGDFDTGYNVYYYEVQPFDNTEKAGDWEVVKALRTKEDATDFMVIVKEKINYRGEVFTV